MSLFTWVLVRVKRWQCCSWHYYVSDLMLVTILRYWWHVNRSPTLYARMWCWWLICNVWDIKCIFATLNACCCLYLCSCMTYKHKLNPNPSLQCTLTINLVVLPLFHSHPYCTLTVRPNPNSQMTTNFYKKSMLMTVGWWPINAIILLFYVGD